VSGEDLTMTACLRLGFLTVLAGVLLCVGLALARPLFGWDGGLDALVELTNSKQRERKLDRANRAVQERNAGKQRVFKEVTARRLTLHQAAAGFRRIHEETWAEINCFDEKAPEDLSDRAMCRAVLTWVRGNPVGQPDDVPLLRELEAEYVRLFGQPWLEQEHRIDGHPARADRPERDPVE
jgi:hypothetical protein